MKFKIINGTIFDPSQKINGKKKDLFIDSGFIVEPKKNELTNKSGAYLDGLSFIEVSDSKIAIDCMINYMNFGKIK